MPIQNYEPPTLFMTRIDTSHTSVSKNSESLLVMEVLNGNSPCLKTRVCIGLHFNDDENGDDDDDEKTSNRYNEQF